MLTKGIFKIHINFLPQTELCRRREEEIAKLRKEKDGVELEAQEAADAAKRKFNDVQNQLEDAEDMLRKYKAK